MNSEFENGYIAAGDHNGSIYLYKAKNKHTQISDALKIAVYTPDAIGELEIVKSHSSSVSQVKFANGRELYSLGIDGKLIYW